MGKGTTKGSVQHYTELEGGVIGCHTWGCVRPATRWIDMERYGNPRFLSTAYCDDDGKWEFGDPHHTMRVRKIK
ncbi:hypothetical protein [Streptomyces tsukubensis]|uniref:hypothetical protein n=1 Tax=Streptomyces tsukubensis TaxID=83656 RepID=UPI00344FAC9D